MIKQWKTAFLISMVWLFSGCKDQQESFSSFEQKVFDQVFYQVVNATYSDKRIYEFYCPDASPIIKNGQFDGFDNPKCNEEIERLKKDTFHLVLAVNDSVLNIPKDEFVTISKQFTVFDSISYQIDITKHQSQKFDFKHLSEIPKDPNLKNWALKYAKFAGALYFSKIYFAKNKESAVLSVAYFAGPKSGRGYRVYIKKSGDKWVIDKLVDTWIS
jgi:hypothetical protein